MAKPLPVLNGFSLPGQLDSLRQQVAKFITPGVTPNDGRTVDDFKPYLLALNLTKRCNLKCDHCYLDATTKAGGGSDELSTEECVRLIDQIAEVNKGCLLVITGGEPLTRPDILDIARHAVQQGFMVVFGTNGMLIDDAMAKRLVEIGVVGVGISIDSLDDCTNRQIGRAASGVQVSASEYLDRIQTAQRLGICVKLNTVVKIGRAHV